MKRKQTFECLLLGLLSFIIFIGGLFVALNGEFVDLKSGDEVTGSKAIGMGVIYALGGLFFMYLTYRKVKD
jgi:hypothetical protein